MFPKYSNPGIARHLDIFLYVNVCIYIKPHARSPTLIHDQSPAWQSATFHIETEKSGSYHPLSLYLTFSPNIYTCTAPSQQATHSRRHGGRTLSTSAHAASSAFTLRVSGLSQGYLAQHSPLHPRHPVVSYTASVTQIVLSQSAFSPESSNLHDLEKYCVC